MSWGSDHPVPELGTGLGGGDQAAHIGVGEHDHQAGPQMVKRPTRRSRRRRSLGELSWRHSTGPRVSGGSGALACTSALITRYSPSLVRKP